MACTDPETGRKLAAFELGRLSREDSEAVEAHLLGCAECFESWRALSEAVPSIRRTLGGGRPARARRLRVAAAAAAVLLAAGILLVPRLLRPGPDPWEAIRLADEAAGTRPARAAALLGEVIRSSAGDEVRAAALVKRARLRAFDLGDRDGAVADARETILLLEPLEPIRDLLIQAHSLLFGIALDLDDDPRAALAYAERILALRIRQQRGDVHRDREADGLNLVGVAKLALYRRSPEREELLAQAERAFTESRRLRVSGIGIAWAENNLGLVLVERRDLDGALARFETALAWKRKEGRERELASTLLNRGSCRLELDDLAGAETDYRRALDIAVASADKLLEVDARYHLALALRERGEVTAAREELARAGAIAAPLRARGRLRRVYEMLRRLERDVLDPEAAPVFHVET